MWKTHRRRYNQFMKDFYANSDPSVLVPVDPKIWKILRVLSDRSGDLYEIQKYDRIAADIRWAESNWETLVENKCFCGKPGEFTTGSACHGFVGRGPLFRVCAEHKNVPDTEYGKYAQQG